MGIVTREDAVELIRQASTAYIEEHDRAPEVIITVGGTAMALRHLREQSTDVDIFHKDDAFSEIARDIAGRLGITCDITNKSNLWGDIVVRDIEEDAEVIESVTIENFHVDIAAISPETLFVIKTAAMRDKDRRDLTTLSATTTPQQILARTDTLLSKIQDPFLVADVLINVVGELQLARLEPVEGYWFNDAHWVVDQYGEQIVETYPHLDLRAMRY